MNRVFTAWGDVEGGEITGFWMGEERPKTGNGEPLWNCVVPLWRIEVGSFEEAMAVYNIRRGFAPYDPGCEPEPCPNCGATYYPGGSAQCWKCD